MGEKIVDEKKKGVSIWVCDEFKEILQKFKDKFFENHGIKISSYDASKILAEKIEKAGGIAPV